MHGRELDRRDGRNSYLDGHFKTFWSVLHRETYYVWVFHNGILPKHYEYIGIDQWFFHTHCHLWFQPYCSHILEMRKEINV